MRPTVFLLRSVAPAVFTHEATRPEGLPELTEGLSRNGTCGRGFSATRRSMLEHHHRRAGELQTLAGPTTFSP